MVYLFEPDSFVPAAKLENRFEAVHTRSGTGAVLYTEHQPTEPTLYSIHTDHLGTPMELAECDGKLAWVGHYRAWGKLTKASDGHGNPSTTDNPLRFQGQYLDDETGLHYNRHRYYDPETGRFTTQDPIGLAGGENLYMYAPNPTGWVDPLGLSRCNCVDVRFRRWKSGDAIDKPMPDGSEPSWNTVRSRYWKNRAASSFGEFSDRNLRLMRRGHAPVDFNPRTGAMESRELHHVLPQRTGGSNAPLNLRELTPDQHGAIDAFRHTVPTTGGIL